MFPRFDELMRAGLGAVGHRPACDRPPATGVHVAGLRARVIEHAVSRPRTRWSEARHGGAPRQRGRPGSATHREGCAGRCIAASSCSSLIGSPSRVTENLGLRGLGHIGRTPYVGGRAHLSSVKKPAPRRLRAGLLPRAHVELAPESCQHLHRSRDARPMGGAAEAQSQTLSGPRCGPAQRPATPAYIPSGSRNSLVDSPTGRGRPLAHQTGSHSSTDRSEAASARHDGRRAGGRRRRTTRLPPLRSPARRPRTRRRTRVGLDDRRPDAGPVPRLAAGIRCPHGLRGGAAIVVRVL